ncbi:Aste57867_18181 [Aphanomyces stellatus]|uniref:Aste57867_18181 protein n=1 Tax=Aphanomyces stellatus TaxID=120398 RepID=A0A485L9P1_9STRA|nr:hypothetical protein As57867_018119 [Aphanomyces stellatus]VFT94919.1 Aste57867_18181 [Aphanomyces stellatus]
MPLDIGEHCSKPGCNQKDFLPFACDCCEGVFCLEHRTYTAHACTNAGSKDSRAITCPLCRATIPLTNDQDVNHVFDQHTRTNCNPDKYNEKKKAKARCEAENCREVLTASNTVQCNACRKKVCLKHRFESDHQCERLRHVPQVRPPPPSSSSAATLSVTAQMQGRLTAVGNSVSSSMSRLVDSAKKASGGTNVTAASESCPICQQTFRYTSQLIAHVNNAHPDSSRRSTTRPAPRPAVAPSAAAAATSNGGAEVCPFCRTTFSQVAQLIEHVERNHPQEAGEKKSECGLM